MLKMRLMLAWMILTSLFFSHAEGVEGGDDGGDDDGGDDGTNNDDDNPNDDIPNDDDDSLSLDDLKLDDAPNNTTKRKQESPEARELKELKTRLDALQLAPNERQRSSHNPFEEEDRKLKDPNTSAEERWQIESNRVIRQANINAQNALMQSQDMHDKTNYAIKSASNAVYKKYEKRVEEELTKMRKNGDNAPREALLRYLVGSDLIDGKIKSRKAATTESGTKKDSTSTANRGTSPNARSDVGKGGKSESEKRRQRLENVPI